MPEINERNINCINVRDLAQIGVLSRRLCTVAESGGPVGPLCVCGGVVIPFLGTPGLLQLT